jgi:capsid assembly protease
MRDYSRIISKITTTPWMMMPGSLKMMLEILEAHLSGNITEEEIRLRMQSAQPREGSSELSRSGAVAVIPLHGPIFPKANMMTEMSGATSLEQWNSQFRQLVADESIGTIIIDADSPGGSSELIPETGAMIRSAREIKPVYAISNTMAASAAYGIVANASKVFASPSALTGAVGTYMVHTDDSELMQRVGVKETVIKAGRFKAVEIESLTPESKAYFEELVGDINDVFLNSIAKGRGVDVDQVRQTYGEGKVFASSRALELGMIDEIATFEDVVNQSLEGGISPRQTRPVGRQSYDADMEHSEPGTGQPPEPREPPEEGDPAIEGGWRRDSPPAAFEPEEVVNREWLEARASALGITFNAETTDEDLATAVSNAVDEIVVPLAEATAGAERARQFAQDYPEEAAQLAAATTSTRQQEAATFAQGYGRFAESNRGFSPVVRSLIQSAHERIALRQFTHGDLKELLDAATAKDATVEYNEKGSSRQPESVDVPTDFRQARQEFARLVNEAMKDDGLDRNAALQHVAKQHPDLAEAYHYGHVR